jgi:hypothetical protein
MGSKTCIVSCVHEPIVSKFMMFHVSIRKATGYSVLIRTISEFCSGGIRALVKLSGLT